MKNHSNPWTTEDLMTVVLGREVQDGDVIHCGAFTPLVLASGMWAMAHHAPNATIFPISLAAVRIFRPFPISYSLLEGMTLAAGVQYTMVDVFTHVEGVAGCGFEPVNPLQVDKFGNINMSVIGDYDSPRLRGPGPAGMDILPIMPRDKLIVYSTRHSQRTLVEAVDFVTGIGNDPDRRRTHGATQGGVKKIVTNLCVFSFRQDGIASLQSIHPGVSLDEVVAATGFVVDIDGAVPETAPPEPGELKVLHEIDPLGIRRFEFLTARERRAALPDLLTRESEYFSTLAATW